jgi:rubrerythrin
VVIFLQAGDITELAMQVEKSGEAFYRAVATKSASPQLRAFFEELANQEVQHYAVFSKLAQSVKDNPLLSEQEWDEYLGYIRSTVDSAFFEGPDKALALAAKAANEKEAIRMAIGFEKETLLFFYDLRDLVTGPAKEPIQRIVDEEKTHIRRLAGML